MKNRVIYWFRTDLRVHDSPALTAALELNPEVLYPVWCWDPNYVYKLRAGPNRWQYLLDCQNSLSETLTKLNPESRLLVVRESPGTILPKLFKAWKITHLVFEKDTNGYARKRDEDILKKCKESGVECIVRNGRTLWDPDDIVEKNGGHPTMTLNQLRKAADQAGRVPRPPPTPKEGSFPSPGDLKLDGVKQTLPPESENPDEEDVNRSRRTSDDATYHSGPRGPNNDFGIPTMSEIGMENKATTPHRGGEHIALETLKKIVSDKTYTATFAKPDTAPTDFEPQSTTLLSPHLHFGSLGIREFFWRVQDAVDEYNKQHKNGATTPPTSLIGQLLFREMYFAAQAAIGAAYVQDIHNPVVRYVPWHLPSITTIVDGMQIVQKTEPSYHVDSQDADEWFTRWRNGTTGFPWIDAIMIQLRTEGWIHHLARHAVACFLTRGGCYIHWERGAAVFEEYLLDHEESANAGNWQWLSCTAFFSQYNRVYSPIAFPKKTDKEGQFVRRYIPALKNFPEKYIYEPWECPIADQKAAGCIVGKDFPKRMFDWDERKRICLEGMKEAFEKGLHGDSKEVLDGTARELFETVAGQGDDNDGGDGEVGKGKKKKKKGGQQTLDGAFTRTKRQKTEEAEG